MTFLRDSLKAGPIAMVVILLALTNLTARNSQQTTKGRAQSITLTLTVTDKSGRYIGGLRKDQVTVVDQELPQEIISFRDADLPVSVGFLFDASVLKLADVLKASHEALLKFIADSHPLNEYFVMGFDSHPYVATSFTNDRNQVAKGISALGKINPSSKKALYDVIQLSMKTVEAGQHAKRVIIMISDDKDDASLLKHGDLLEIIKKRDVLLYPIRVKVGNYDPSSSVLNEFSLVTGGMTFYPKTSVDFTEAFEVIALELRHQYSLEYKSETSSTGMWHSLKVRIEPLRLQNSKEVPLFSRSRVGYYSRP